MRRRAAAAILLAAVSAAPSLAQSPGYQPPDVAEQADKIAALSFLSGEWEGAGWTYTGPGQRVEFKQTENIEFMLGGKLLVIHGAGRPPGGTSDGPPDFEAFAVVSWDDKEDAYRMRSYASGHVGDFDAVLEDGQVFVWRMPNTEYRIAVDGDTWTETGHRTLADGSRFQFFEMTLTRR